MVQIEGSVFALRAALQPSMARNFPYASFLTWLARFDRDDLLGSGGPGEKRLVFVEFR